MLQGFIESPLGFWTLCYIVAAALFVAGKHAPQGMFRHDMTWKQFGNWTLAYLAFLAFIAAPGILGE